jgi:hypothetical protein
MTLTITHYKECHYAEFRDLCIVLLNVITLNVVAPILRFIVYLRGATLKRYKILPLLVNSRVVNQPKI